MLNDPPLPKRALRAAMRAERDRFAATAPPPVMPPAAFVARLAPGRVVAAYHPIGGEADPAHLISAARECGCIVALPVVVDRATPIAFASADLPLGPGPFGLVQPPADAPPLSPDIILTPLVAFDAALERLGQGAGHYDRAFAAWPDAWRLGIAWSVQQVAALATDAWDVPLHAIVTETGFFQREEKR